MPTPAHVPVITMSPGLSVIWWESEDNCSAIENTMRDVCESWRSSSLIQARIESFWGSAMNAAGVIQGPIGQEPSNPFWPSQSK